MTPTFKELADGLREAYAKRTIRKTPEGVDRIDYHALSFYCLNKAPELIEALERAAELEADADNMADALEAVADIVEAKNEEELGQALDRLVSARAALKGGE